MTRKAVPTILLRAYTPFDALDAFAEPLLRGAEPRVRRAEVFDLLRQSRLQARELRRAEARDVHCVPGRGVSAWIEGGLEGLMGRTDLLLVGGGRRWLLLSCCEMEWRMGMPGGRGKR